MAEVVPKAKDHGVNNFVLSQEFVNLRNEVVYLACHTIVLGLSLISIWLIHVTLSYFLGKEAKFFDRMPIRYVTDAADVVVLGKFLWHAIKTLRK